MNQSVSENETLHNNNTVQDLLYIEKLKQFDMVMAKVVLIRHGMSLMFLALVHLNHTK